MGLREHASVRGLAQNGRNGLRGLQVRTKARAWSAGSNARRRQLFSAVPDVHAVSVGPFGLVGMSVSRYSAAGAAAEDLAMVAGLLDEAGIPYFLVSEAAELRPVLGLEECHRQALLAIARRRLRATPAYVGVVNEHDVVSSAALWADGRIPEAARRAGVLRIGRVRLGPEGQVLHGLRLGCDIEFWQRGTAIEPGTEQKYTWLRVPARQLEAAFADSLVSPRLNRVAEVLPPDARKPATTTVGGRDYPTFEPFAAPGVSDVAFPVDVVYTWVDGNDPALAARRSAYREFADGGIAVREVGPSRYTSHDELKYSLRSLEMYGGFVRHVYLVTDGQVPSWLDRRSDWITVVDHRDLFPADALPVFNSHAIESRLHHIPGLSDHYLYFNDDVFVNRPIRPEVFFHGSGIAKLPFSPHKLGVGSPRPSEPAPNSAGKNARELIMRTFGRSIVSKSLHVPHPQLLSVFREIEEAGFAEVERTTYSKFRSISDVASAATLHHHWALLSGRGVPGDYSLRYVDVGRPDMYEKLARLDAGQDVDFFCLNDVDTSETARRQMSSVLRAFLERRFPFPSRAERMDAAQDVKMTSARPVIREMDAEMDVEQQA